MFFHADATDHDETAFSVGFVRIMKSARTGIGHKIFNHLHITSSTLPRRTYSHGAEFSNTQKIQSEQLSSFRPLFSFPTYDNNDFLSDELFLLRSGLHHSEVIV